MRIVINEPIRVTTLAGDETAPLRELAVAARKENLKFVDRLLSEMEGGSNRFNRTGENLFGVFSDGKLVAVGGLNRDPYKNGNGVGRVRRLYVHPEYRRQGVGSALVGRILESARSRFWTLTLRTEDDRADAFYRAVGFEKTAAFRESTHVLYLEKHPR
jgi:GNAT superfamily N-acetyltransferase